MNFSISPYAPGREAPLYNFGSQESEEERRRRELQAQMDAQARQAAISDEAVASGGAVAPVEPTPIKETRTIDPATGEVKLKIEGSERDLSAANANTPTYSGAVKPVAPDETFNRMMQVESGGRQTDAQGQVLTSSKGALGVAQVMPTTAMQPGYGVPSIFDLAQKRGIPVQNRDLATAQQLLANRDLNQEFGANYYAAMKNRFDGGPGAVAAYNAGPGRVSQNMAQNQGQLNVAQLPQETQGYLQKVGMPAPGQQAPRPVSPEQAAQQPMPANQGIKIPGLTPVGQMPAPTPSLTTQAQQMFQQNQDNIDELMKMRNDPNAPEYLRRRSGERAYELMNTQYKTDQATAKFNELVASGDQNAIARVLTSKPRDEEGSWLKMIALGFISPQLAGQEAIKLGLAPTKWAQTTFTGADGRDVAVELQQRVDGKILGGTRMDGTPLTTEELNLAGGALGSKLNIVGGTFVNDKTGEVGRVVSDEKTGRTYVQTDKGRRPMEGFRPQSSTGTAADQRAKLIQDMNIKLQGKTLEQQMTIQQDYNKLLVGQGLAPLQPNDTPLTAPQIAGAPTVATAPAVAGTVPAAGAPTAMPSAGGARPAAGAVAPGAMPAAGPRPTASQIAATAEQQKQEAQEVGVDLGKVRTNFGKSKDAATRLINQAEELITDPGFSVSVGASAQPFFQYIPGSDRATWKAKHEEVVGQTFLTAIESLKGMGALSDKEGAAATAAISRLKNTDQNEDSFKAAVKELQFIVKRGVDRNAEKLGREKPFGTSEPEVGTADLLPQARAAAELERRKKEKR